MHITAYDFPGICDRVYRKQDDTSTGVILAHTYPDCRYWDSPFLPGDPFYLDSNYPLDLNAIVRNCSGRVLYSAAKVIAFHTSGKMKLINLARKLRTAPLDIAFEWKPRAFRLCRAPREALENIVSDQNLRKWTPIVSFRWGGQEITWTIGPTDKGPMECRQCLGLTDWTGRGEQQRLEAWNRTGWPFFYG
jgi:hypothetical protein